MERRVAAILAAHVDGHSRLMGEDEAGKLDALKMVRKGLVVPEIAIVKTNHKTEKQTGLTDHADGPPIHPCGRMVRR